MQQVGQLLRGIGDRLTRLSSRERAPEFRAAAHKPAKVEEWLNVWIYAHQAVRLVLLLKR
jgi:hypothetical protein